MLTIALAVVSIAMGGCTAGAGQLGTGAPSIGETSQQVPSVATSEAAPTTSETQSDNNDPGPQGGGLACQQQQFKNVTLCIPDGFTDPNSGVDPALRDGAAWYSQDPTYSCAEISLNLFTQTAVDANIQGYKTLDWAVSSVSTINGLEALIWKQPDPYTVQGTDTVLPPSAGTTLYLPNGSGYLYGIGITTSNECDPAFEQTVADIADTLNPRLSR